MAELGWVDLVGVGGVGVCLAIVQVFVRPKVSDPRWYPIAAVIVGCVLNVVAGAALHSPWDRVALYCLLAGLASSGSYSLQERVRSLAAGTPPDA